MRGAAGHQQGADRQAVLPRIGALLAMAQGLADNCRTVQQLDADHIGQKRRGDEIAVQHQALQLWRFGPHFIDRCEVQRQAKQGLAGWHREKVDCAGERVARQIPAQVARGAPARCQLHDVLHDTVHRHGHMVA
jgi:hypothetical protein